MAGTFRTDSTFFIKGHGLFVRGKMSAGTVRVGGLLAIPSRAGPPREERITRVELKQAPDARGDIQPLVGLQLGALAPADVPVVRRLLVPGMELLVADPESGYVAPETGPVDAPSWSP
jgi:hypothetical protein